jgi:hypothetical protein
MAEIVAERLVERLQESGFVIMQKQPAPGDVSIGRGFAGDNARMTSAMAARKSNEGAKADCSICGSQTPIRRRLLKFASRYIILAISYR